MSSSSNTSTPRAGAATRALRILHVEDSLLDHELLQAQLERGGLSVHLDRVDSPAAFENALRGGPWDVILSDYRLPGFGGMQALDMLRASGLLTPFIILSGEIGEDTAVEAMRRGASDYLLKERTARLVPAIERAMAAAESQRERLRSEAELAESRARLAELAQHLQSSIEEERASIAREIHDEIGGSLAALKFDLAWIERHAVTPALGDRAHRAQELLAQVMSATQRIMISLRPAILDQGLPPALQWLCRGFSQRTDIECVLRLPEALPVVGDPVALAAFRTVQEALTNVSKHAQARRVTVDVLHADELLSIEVSDDGKGWKAVDLEKPGSFGLRGLHERAHQLGGWLDLTSSGEGSSVILSLPLERVGAGALGAERAETAATQGAAA